MRSPFHIDAVKNLFLLFCSFWGRGDVSTEYNKFWRISKAPLISARKGIQSHAFFLWRREHEISVVWFAPMLPEVTITPNWPKQTPWARPTEVNRLLQDKLLDCIISKTALWAKSYVLRICIQKLPGIPTNNTDPASLRVFASFFCYFMFSFLHYTLDCSRLKTRKYKKRHGPQHILILSKQRGRSRRNVRTGKSESPIRKCPTDDVQSNLPCWLKDKKMAVVDPSPTKCQRMCQNLWINDSLKENKMANRRFWRSGNDGWGVLTSISWRTIYQFSNKNGKLVGLGGSEMGQKDVQAVGSQCWGHG